MPDGLPSISEILGQPTAANRSTTALGASFDISQGVAQVFQAAQMKQQADWQRYGQFTKNLQDVIGDIENIGKMEVAPEDRPTIMAKMAESLKYAKDNLGAIANPMADPAAFADVKAKAADAYSLAMKSKQRHAYDIATKSFIQQNPEWATPQNKQILQSSFSTPLEQWQPYQLGNPMPAFDINQLAADANKFAENPNFMEVIGEVGGKDPATGKYTKGNEWIATRKGTVYDEPKFTDKWGSYINYADENGINTIRDWTKTFVFDQLNDKEKKRLEATGDPIKAAWMEYGKNLRGKDKVGEELTKSSEWETKFEQGQQNYRSRLSSRGSGGSTAATPTNTESSSLYDYFVEKTPNLKNGVDFRTIDTAVQEFLQSQYEREDKSIAGTKTVRIPDDARVKIGDPKYGDDIIVFDRKGKLLGRYSRATMDNLYNQGVAGKLSGKDDYKQVPSITPLSTGTKLSGSAAPAGGWKTRANKIPQ